MLSDITLGQYFSGKSFLHRLDPRIKIIVSSVILVFIFIASKTATVLFLWAITCALIAISRIPFRTFLKALKMLGVILMISFVFIAFANDEKYTHMLFGFSLFGKFDIVMFGEGLEKAIVTSMRIICLIMTTSLLLTYTTSPIELTDGIERVLNPLSKIGVPVHDFAMIMSIALRFIPTLLEETDRIMNAQRSRGADFTSGGIVKRVKALLPIFIPLLISSFRRAIELATAMECRCYHGKEGRTKMNRPKLKTIDFMFLSGAAAVCILIPIINSLSPSVVELADRLL